MIVVPSLSLTCSGKHPSFRRAPVGTKAASRYALNVLTQMSVPDRSARRRDDAPSAAVPGKSIQRVKAELRGQDFAAQEARLAPPPMGGAAVQMEAVAGAQVGPAGAQVGPADAQVGQAAANAGQADAQAGQAGANDTPKAGVSEVRNELLSASISLTTVSALAPAFDVEVDVGKRYLGRYITECIRSVNRASKWQESEGSAALEAMRESLADFVGGQIIELTLGEIPVVGTFMELGLSAADHQANNAKVDDGIGNMRLALSAVQEFNGEAVAGYMTQLQHMSGKFGGIDGMMDTLLGPHALGNIRSGISAETQQLAAHASPSDDVLMDALADARRLRGQADKLKRDVLTMKAFLARQIQGLEGAIGAARDQGKAAYDQMVANYIKSKADKNQALSQWAFDLPNGINVTGIAGVDGRETFVHLMTDDLEVGPETRAHFEKMTWKDFRKHKIPIFASFNNSGGTAMSFDQTASGGRSAESEEDIFGREPEVAPAVVHKRIWHMLDTHTFGELFTKMFG